MKDSFKSLIAQSKSILILLPTKPYFDQVAAGLALYLALRENKEASIVSPTPITVEFNRLVGVNKISSEVGNKNLIIKFADYNANDIERVSYDIENGQIRLTVVPKPGVTPPKREQARLSYSGVASDTVILIGGANEGHFPAITSHDLAGANMVHVGKKDLSLSSKRDIISFSGQASSISEIVTGLINESGVSVDSDIATNLLMGIEEGSNNFTDEGVGAETFQIMADLMKAGGVRSRKVSPQRRDFPPGAIPAELPKRVLSKQKVEQPPKDWLKPKVYKGTSIS
jgi:hypothetical protein